MSDFASSLPIRTETDGDVVVKIGDGTLPTQQLAVNADGSVNITDNGASLTVDATDLDIRDLAFATDSVDVSGSSVEVSNGAGAAAVNIQDGGNSITVDATDLDIRNLAFATDKVDVTGSDITATVTATDLDIRDLVFATDKVDTSGSVVALDAPTLAALESITVQNGAGASSVNIQDGGNSITVDAIDLDIRNLSHSQDSVKIGDGTDFLAVNTDGSINVVIADGTPGTAINDYNTAVLAGGASDNHDYTVTALKTLSLNQIETSASGKMKIEVQIETGIISGVFITKFVKFNSTADTGMSIHIENPIAVAAGVRVRIIRTNNDNQSQSVYSTISGYELP